MTPSEIDELERLMTAATEGRWSVNALRVVRGNEVVCTLPLNYRGPAPADAAAIVALHNAAPALIEAAREVERLRAFVPRWKHTGGMWALFAGCANIGEIDSLGIGWAREGIGYVICYRPMGASPDLPTAARAVCARLGIPYVPVEVSDG